MVKLWGRLKSAFLADAPSDQSLQKLETSFSFLEGVRRLRLHKWHKRDLHYLVMFPVLIYCFIICESPGLLFKSLFALVLLYLCMAPIFAQFFVRFMPTATYLFLFYVCRYISPAIRPPIFVRVLPGLETIFYGGDLSETLAASPNKFCDILAWLPYGLAHYGAPFVVSLIIFLFGPPSSLPTFHFVFGYMNLFAVVIQVVFPNAPPWYRKLYGLAKADYSMRGSPGGLARIDKLLGINLYTSGFEGNPMVFGAFPSLHSGDAVLEALFLSHLFPRYAPVFGLYVMWIWWATMYLTHHYFVDLIGGGVLSLFAFYLCRTTILAKVDYSKFGRWSYSHITFGNTDFKGENNYYSRGYSIYDEETQADQVDQDVEEEIEMETLR